MRKILGSVALWAAITVVVPNLAASQWPPEFLQNVQALPEDISVREVQSLMRSFAGALGVRCTYCHLGDNPDDLSTMNFVSDEKIEKRKAREMIRMTRSINQELLAGVPERSEPPVEVSCRTCHHSRPLPIGVRDLLVAKFEAEGAEPTIALYRELREEHYGSDSYDFRHFVLANVAERVAEANPKGAIQLLEFNGEIHPTSGQTFATMGRIYRDLGDIESAIRSIERALDTDPENAFYRRVLEQLASQLPEGAVVP